MANDSTEKTKENIKVDKSGEAEASRKDEWKERQDQQQPKSHLEVLPQILWLLTQSPKHKHLYWADLDWYLMAPLQIRQFCLFFKDKTPIGFASWAYVFDEVEKRLAAGVTRVRPRDGKSGDKLWLVDPCTPFDGWGKWRRDIVRMHSRSR